MGKVRLGINGFGRTGRTAARIAIENEAIQLVAINSRAGAGSHAYLLEYDSVHGRFPHKIAAKDSFLFIDGEKVYCFQGENPADIPWSKAGVDLVFEATGKMKERSLVAGHFKHGAKKVIVTYPLDMADKTIVFGVNQEAYDPKKDQIVSCASCTTSCLSVLCKVLDERFTIKRGCATTCHTPTMSQRVLDGSHDKDKRRGRAAFLNIVPTTTGAATQLGKVIPKLSGKLESVCLRVPVGNVSIIDLVVETEEKVTVSSVVAAFKKAARSGSLKGILEIAENELVSQDIIGRSASAVFDPNLTRVIDNSLVKVFGWYDNEWGYSSRLIDFALYLFQKGL